MTDTERSIETVNRIHIRDQAGNPLCGADAPLSETLPASSIQPREQPDTSAWAEDRLPKKFACSPCLTLKDETESSAGTAGEEPR